MIKKVLLAAALLAAIGGNLYVDQLQAQTTNSTPPVGEIKLTVTPGELELISEGLQTQPFGKVWPLINKLRQQFVEQQPKPITPPANSPAPQAQ